LHRLNEGEDHWVVPTELAKAQTDMRQQEDDPWLSRVVDFSHDCMVIRTQTLLGPYCLNVRTEFQNPTHTRRLGQIMRKLGFDYNYRMIDGVRQKAWIVRGIENRRFETDAEKLKKMIPAELNSSLLES